MSVYLGPAPHPEQQTTNPQFVSPTFNADLIDDNMRSLSLQGDGTVPIGRIGIWKAATNLVTNGGFETNTTGYSNDSIVSLTRVTNVSKFGAACGEIVTSNAQANEGIHHSFTATVASYSVSAWVRGAGGGTVRMAVRDNSGANPQTGSAVTLTTSWQRITLLTTNLTAATWRVYIETSAQQSITFQVDGVQAELATGFGTVGSNAVQASPYIETDGGTASRTAGTITFPGMNNYCTPTQGWIALRFRWQFATVADPNAFLTCTWGDDATHRLCAYSRFDLDSVAFERGNGAPTARTAGVAYAANAATTMISRWTATTIGVSLNGAGFSDTANALIPTLSSTILTINSGQQANYYWILIGSGTISDANAATIGALGDYIGPTPPSAFPATCKLAWQAGRQKAWTIT